MPESKEEVVVLFPRTCLSRDDPYTRINGVTVDEHLVRVTVLESYHAYTERVVYYDFDHNFGLVKAFVSSEFRTEHIKLERSGVLSDSWKQDEAELPRRLESRRNLH